MAVERLVGEEHAGGGIDDDGDAVGGLLLRGPSGVLPAGVDGASTAREAPA